MFATLKNLRPTRTGKRMARAFTLVEIMIVVLLLGIIAAIVMPQFSDASHVTREKVLKEDLRFLRNQVAVYAIQHHDRAPGYSGGSPSAAAFADQMTKFTDMNGNVSATQD